MAGGTLQGRPSGRKIPRKNGEPAVHPAPGATRAAACFIPAPVQSTRERIRLQFGESGDSKEEGIFFRKKDQMAEPITMLLSSGNTNGFILVF